MAAVREDASARAHCSSGLSAGAVWGVVAGVGDPLMPAADSTACAAAAAASEGVGGAGAGTDIDVAVFGAAAAGAAAAGSAVAAAAAGMAVAAAAESGDVLSSGMGSPCAAHGQQLAHHVDCTLEE